MRLRQKLAEVRREGRAFEKARATAQGHGSGPHGMFHAANVPVPPTVAAHTEAILTREARARESAIRAARVEAERHDRYRAEVLIRATGDRVAAPSRAHVVGPWMARAYVGAERAERAMLTRTVNATVARGMAPFAPRLARAVQEGRDMAPTGGALPYVPPGMVSGNATFHLPTGAARGDLNGEFARPDAGAQAALDAGATVRWHREIDALRWQRRMVRRAIHGLCAFLIGCAGA